MIEGLNLELVDVEEHRRLGLKGIFPGVPKVAQMKPPKPKLNTDDLFEL